MQIRTIDEGLSVGPQIAPEQVAELKARGFRSVICNRPDAEEPGQPSFAAVAEAARIGGLQARHIPVAGTASEAQATEFAAALRDLPGPVYAYCRSGSRSAHLAARAGHPAR